jgi:hypothetical protein
MEKQIKEWKSQHGNIVEIAIEKQVSYFRTPSLSEFAMGQATSQGNNVRLLEDLMEKCFLGGYDYKQVQGFSAQMAYLSAFSKALEPKSFEIKNV